MLTSFELRSRAENLLSEQKERLEKQRRQLEKERLVQQRQQEREAAREEEARQRRLQEIEAAEKAERQREEATEWNRGVYLLASLQPMELNEAIAAAKGIRRSKDKVVLPPSLGASLMDQQAARNGAMLFQLTSRTTGLTTHAGLLEFTAPEGVVLMPAKVRQCLFGNGGEPSGLVDVQYKRLEKGTFVRFQPLSRDFHESVGDDVREVLEAALMQHSTLSIGDTLQVEHVGIQHTLRVTDLQPQPAVSVVDTDVEAEVVASVETEQLIQAWEEEQRRNAQRMAELRAAREKEAEMQRMAREQEEEIQRQAAEQAAQEAAAAAAAQQAAVEARLAALPPEPPADGPQPTVVCSFRLPDGSRLRRRFVSDAPTRQLFEYVDAHGAGGCGDLGYNLVTQFPRRTIVRPEGDGGGSGAQAMQSEGVGREEIQQGQEEGQDTLQLLGLGQGGQELFLLEPLSPE